MSAFYISLLLILTGVCTALLVHVRSLSRKLDARTATAPCALDEVVIRRAVTEALAADREREINEARAFWAEQEARAAEDTPGFDRPFLTAGEEWPLFFPRPIGPEDAADNAETMNPEFGQALRNALEGILKDDRHDSRDGGEPEAGARPGHPAPGHPISGHPVSGHPTTGHPMPGVGPVPAESTNDFRARREADLLATGLDAGLLDPDAEPATKPDPRRHPSHPEFVPSPMPSREWTDDRLTTLADEKIALTDVRPGPLGTLDVYAFADGTTLCVAPGDREAAYRLIDAVRAGEDVRLLGGSRFSGSYSLTFSTDDDAVYVLADRVVASV